MGVKYIFVTGGVVSGLGKGITAASLGRLLKARGYRVTMQKLDPYINVDPGTMNPMQHGEVFVTEDGTETDLDLGHYERFIDENLNHNSNVTTGKIYLEVLNRERRGDYGGGTVQVIPHITDEIKARFYQEIPSQTISSQEISSLDRKNGDTICIIEVGGTVGDMESQPYLEAIRQFIHEKGRENALLIHVTLIPYLKASGELKTKPTQMSVRELQSMGLWPDILVCRCDLPLDEAIKEKIALFCNVKKEHVLQNLDAASLYEVPLMMEKEQLAQAVCECLKLPCREPELSDWKNMVEAQKNPQSSVTVALIGKYMELHDAYLSVAEALRHGGIANRAYVNIRFIDSDKLEAWNLDTYLRDADAILVPGGFGARGIEGKLLAIGYAREKQIPFLGICLGMQLAIIEFLRNTALLKLADSIEFNPETPAPVIALMEQHNGRNRLGGTLRLGTWPCILKEGTLSHRLYGRTEISERHRHRYEVNNDYRRLLSENGMMIAGTSPDGKIVEMVELTGHPFFIATQAHPEFKSRPNRAHPLFTGLIAAAVNKNGEKICAAHKASGH